MRACAHLEIETPKGVLLNALLMGPKKPTRVIVWVHGLGSSLFSKLNIADALVDKNTAVLAFNNRGHDNVSHIVSIKKKRGGFAGKAHEIFTECLDDIEGAVREARKMGARDIYLAGHSTGAQKSIFWAAKKGDGIAGVILLAPLSDYAGALKSEGKKKIARAEKAARMLVRKNKEHAFVPENLWSEDVDAQRFLSLYTPESIEQSIFPYFDPQRRPTLLKKVRQPVLVLIAADDEYADRPAENIEGWFAQHLKTGDQIAIIPGATHGFRGEERIVARVMKKFIEMYSS
ncbi:MAG TPA: alpha/beta fold hydrolase [Candidatus Paceibacterota bacterium]|nr:alpha/beta fold hydrolase [Candidatus Paceibacterota bacterium]